jgi:membrane protein implicated in regulation of membrane protease activity
MSEFLGAIPAHKFWSLAILFITPVLVLVAVRFGELTPENTQPWSGILCLACAGLWIVLMALDDPRADYVTSLMISLGTTLAWIDWFKRRSEKRRTP